MIACHKCNVTKPRTDYHRDTRKKDGYRNTCKECVLKYVKNNRPRYRENCNKWRAANPGCREKWYEENKHKSVEYYQKNREKIYEYIREKKKTDPNYRLAHNLRNRVTKLIKTNGKTSSAIKDLGITVEVLLVYLNLDCLDKYGVSYTRNTHIFSIDHIKPLASFDLTDRIQWLEACNWKNLQILTKSENSRKGARI